MRGAVALLGAALRGAPTRAGRTRVLAIDGRSGAGKTSLAEELRTGLDARPEEGVRGGLNAPEEEGVRGEGDARPEDGVRAGGGVAVVSLEGLYGGWGGLESGVELLVSEVLGPIAAGRAAYVPRYDWGRRGWATPVRLDPPRVLIVEGVGAGARRAAVFESLLVWLEAPLSVRKKRALDRDGETFAPYWDRWAAQEEAMLARERTPERADVVIDGVSGGIVRSRHGAIRSLS